MDLSTLHFPLFFYLQYFLDFFLEIFVALFKVNNFPPPHEKSLNHKCNNIMIEMFVRLDGSPHSPDILTALHVTFF